MLSEAWTLAPTCRTLRAVAIPLRPYPQEAVTGILHDWSRGKRRTILTMPTGTGKTAVMAYLARYVAERKGRTLILVHTDELIEQTLQSLAQFGLRAGVVKASCREWNPVAVVGSVQTVGRRGNLEGITPKAVSLLVVDECHFSNAATYQRVMAHFTSSYQLGCTATPFRGDRKSLAKAGWDTISYAYPLVDAIQQGWLVRPNVFRIPTGVDISSVPVAPRGGLEPEHDYVEKRLGSLVDNPARNEQAVDAYLRHTAGERALAFGVTVEHAYNLANAFRANGVLAYAIHGGMDRQERFETLAAHKRGEFPVLANCAVLTHGYDDPDLRCLVLARPTRSRTLAVQIVGRGLRPAEDKRFCTILDLADVSEHKLGIADELRTLLEELAVSCEPDVPEGCG